MPPRPLRVFAALLALALLLPVAARSAPILIGTWEVRNERGSLSFTFAADGTGSLNGLPLHWSVDDGLLALTIRGNTIEYEMSLTGPSLTLSGGDLAQAVELQRAEAPRPDTRIVGKWRAANGAVFEFKPDGTGANARGPFQYKATEGTLIFLSAEGSRLMQYRVEGKQLVLSAEGASATFTRAEAGAAIQSRGPGAARSVSINRARLADKQVSVLERQFQVRVLDGSYWYDKACGAWGLEGGPTLGFIPAGLDLGGALRADASGGGTGVFINGRELHPLDVADLQQITQVVPGRYWVDAQGFCGHEGSPAPIMNLTTLAQAARARSGSAYHSRSDITGIGSGGDGRTSYVMGKDWSVIIGE
jgi:hypothetical protein